MFIIYVKNVFVKINGCNFIPQSALKVRDEIDDIFEDDSSDSEDDMATSLVNVSVYYFIFHAASLFCMYTVLYGLGRVEYNKGRYF